MSRARNHDTDGNPYADGYPVSWDGSVVPDRQAWDRWAERPAEGLDVRLSLAFTLPGPDLADELVREMEGVTGESVRAWPWSYETLGPLGPYADEAVEIFLSGAGAVAAYELRRLAEKAVDATVRWLRRSASRPTTTVVVFGPDGQELSKVRVPSSHSEGRPQD